MKLDDVPKLPEWQRLRQQHSQSNDIGCVPNLVIRRPSLVHGPGGEQYTWKLSGGNQICFFVYRSSVSLKSFFLNLIIFVMRHYCYTVGSLASSRGSVGSSESPDNNNYLRVSTAFGQRRLSDNVLNAPGHRRLSNTMNAVGSPCVSSPGSAPNTPIVGFPIRRHSSAAFAQNRRYSSNALLSPSTGSQVSKKGILQTNRYG